MTSPDQGTLITRLPILELLCQPGRCTSAIYLLFCSDYILTGTDLNHLPPVPNCRLPIEIEFQAIQVCIKNLSFIYSIYHMSKAVNNFPVVKVAAILVITPQGARKTIAQQTAEKWWDECSLPVKLHCSFIYWCTTDIIGQHFLKCRCTGLHRHHKHKTHMMANSRCVVAIILINIHSSNPHQFIVSQAVKGLNTSHYW